MNHLIYPENQIVKCDTLSGAPNRQINSPGVSEVPASLTTLTVADQRAFRFVSKRCVLKFIMAASGRVEASYCATTLPRSPTIDTLLVASEMIKQGKTVYNFGVGKSFLIWLKRL